MLMLELIDRLARDDARRPSWSLAKRLLFCKVVVTYPLSCPLTPSLAVVLNQSSPDAPNNGSTTWVSTARGTDAFGWAAVMINVTGALWALV